MDEKIRLIVAPVTRAEVKTIAKERQGDMVKAVVDVDRGVMAIGGEMHADEEAFLLDQDSKQQNLWGINLYPDNVEEDFVEYDSMINIRPRQGNRSRSVEDEAVRRQIVAIVDKLII